MNKTDHKCIPKIQARVLNIKNRKSFLKRLAKHTGEYLIHVRI